MELETLNATFVIDTFLLLLIGVGPKIALVPFLEATEQMPEDTKRRVLRKMLTTAATVAVLLLILGGLLTRLLHFSPGALGVASGIILLIIAVTMVLGHQGWTAAATRWRTRTRCRSPSSRWPCPTCSTRPGSSSWSPPRPKPPRSRCSPSSSASSSLILALDVAVFRWAVHVSNHLDASRMLVTEKVFGFLLAALGVQLALNGLSDVGVIHLTGH